MKHLIFEMPIITQTLNIKNMKLISKKSIKLHTFKELIEYSFKNFLSKDNVYSHQFQDVAVRRSVSSVTQLAGHSERKG